jgi:hypothetical protein
MYLPVVSGAKLGNRGRSHQHQLLESGSSPINERPNYVAPVLILRHQHHETTTSLDRCGSGFKHHQPKSAIQQPRRPREIDSAKTSESILSKGTAIDRL